MKRRIAILIPAVVLAFVCVYYFSGWSKINCWTWEIDINSGEKRYTRYWFFVATSQKIESTWMSEALAGQGVETGRDWQLVYTLSPGRHNSPHYAYHGTISHLAAVDRIREYFPLSDAELLQLAKDVRKLWKQHCGDDEAETHINNVLAGKIDSAPASE